MVPFVDITSLSRVPRWMGCLSGCPFRSRAKMSSRNSA